MPELTRGPFLLVTPGGGGDGEGLIDWVLKAYESNEMLPLIEPCGGGFTSAMNWSLSEVHTHSKNSNDWNLKRKR